MKEVVYLTGSTGFVGQAIVRACHEDELIEKVYCPVRDKKGKTGLERFDALLGGYKKNTFINIKDDLPSDVTRVILNAYGVKFFVSLQKILKDNVEPMLSILEQCEKTGVKGISIVSTAYVQPPLPYQRRQDNRVPFLLRDVTTPSKFYEEVVAGSVQWPQELDELGVDISSHHKINTYAFSKHLMECLIHERFPRLPISIVRPSIVAPCRNGEIGQGVRTGLLAFADLAHHPVVRFPRSEGQLNGVFVEDVAADIVRGACHEARPAEEEDKAYYHPVISSTSSSAFTAMELFRLIAPNVSRFEVKNDVHRDVLRAIELVIIRFVKGQRAARLVGTIYENFDHVMSETWDFEKAHEPVAAGDVVKFSKLYFENAKISQRATRTLSTPSLALLLVLLAIAVSAPFVMLSPDMWGPGSSHMLR